MHTVTRESKCITNVLNNLTEEGWGESAHFSNSVNELTVRLKAK
jgi:hypothetical protein